MTLEHARALRRRQTDAEKILWLQLRDRRFSGLKFRRQQMIEPYIVDFVCHEPKLIIELDGGQHAQQQAYDAARTQYLERLGYRVLRFWNNDVLTNIDAVLQALLLSISPPSPQPSPGGRGGEAISPDSTHPLLPAERVREEARSKPNSSLPPEGDVREESPSQIYPSLAPKEGWSTGITTAKQPQTYPPLSPGEDWSKGIITARQPQFYPPLSPGEDRSKGIITTKQPQFYPPLPPGEGWGEGVVTAQQPTLLTRNLTRRDYTETWHAMQQFTAQRDATTPDEIWLLEHPPVFTQGLNGKREHLLSLGDIPLVQTDRGGQVTYHGQGQLVVYVLLDLQRRGWGVRQLVEALELAVIDLLRDYGISALARRDAPGVYVDGAKIAALGLRVKHGRSYHGLSLNVAMDLEPFNRINPCGYAGLPVTQLTTLGPHNNLAEVAGDLLRHLTARLGYNSQP